MIIKIQLSFLIVLFGILPAAAQTQIPTADAVPDELFAEDKAPLSQQRSALMDEFTSLNGLIASHDAKCSHVADTDQWLIAACTAEMQDVQSKIQDYYNKLNDFKSLIATQLTRVHDINNMYAISKYLHWSKDKRAHLNKTLKALDSDGNAEVTDSQVIQTWQDVLARRDTSGIFEQEASSQSPVIPGAGTQSFEDCTIFALANAANLPYSVVAAHAAELITEEKWRSKEEHGNPQEVLEKHGLNGYEVDMLAEALGHPKVVPMSDFPKVLKNGSPIILGVTLQDGHSAGLHEVVLTKTFKHNGETWYEMMDSNQSPQKRLYLSANELGNILLEKGIVYHSDSGTTPKLLQ